MKVFLRNRATRLYLCGADGWSWDRTLARDFRQSGDAFEFVSHKRWADMEAVLAFDEAQYDLCLAVTLRTAISPPP